MITICLRFYQYLHELLKDSTTFLSIPASLTSRIRKTELIVEVFVEDLEVVVIHLWIVSKIGEGWLAFFGKKSGLKHTLSPIHQDLSAQEASKAVFEPQFLGNS